MNIKEFFRNLWYGKPYKNGYLIHEMPRRFMGCKVLNEYDNVQDARNDLMSVVTRLKKEKDLEKGFSQKNK